MDDNYATKNKINDLIDFIKKSDNSINLNDWTSIKKYLMLSGVNPM